MARKTLQQGMPLQSKAFSSLFGRIPLPRKITRRVYGFSCAGGSVFYFLSISAATGPFPFCLFYTCHFFFGIGPGALFPHLASLLNCNSPHRFFLFTLKAFDAPPTYPLVCLQKKAGPFRCLCGAWEEARNFSLAASQMRAAQVFASLFHAEA